MLCPFCGNETTHVKDSRPSEITPGVNTNDGKAVTIPSIRRRRMCPNCLIRFTTYEVLDSVISSPDFVLTGVYPSYLEELSKSLKNASNQAVESLKYMADKIRRS